ncbi:MAG: hypothetical protein QOC87_1723 [Actinomycetota bacterium]|nr:hypothetical protein [Actinomycetota bacterium]
MSKSDPPRATDRSTRHWVRFAGIATLLILIGTRSVPGALHTTPAARAVSATKPFGQIGQMPSSHEMERALALIHADGENADPTGRRGAGRAASTYFAGTTTSQSQPSEQTSSNPQPSMRLFRTGVMGLEPTLGINKQGWVFAAGARQQTLGTTASLVMRSTDQGSSWLDLSPLSPTGGYLHTYSEDPYLYVDPTTGRVFDDDLVLPCQLLSRSDNGGTNWTTNADNCEQADHQNIFAGPPGVGQGPPLGYPNVLYDCAINGGALSPTSTATTCTRSRDGGNSWFPSGDPPFVTDPNQPEGNAGVPGLCDGDTGQGFVGTDGTVYLPRGWCGQPYLAISHDEGASWTRVQVATNGMDFGDSGPPDNTPVYDHEAAVVTDRDGNIYYLWVAHDYQPYLAISRDGGTSWSAPMRVSPPNVTQSVLPAIAIHPSLVPGKLAIAYMGSENAPADPYPHTADRYTNSTWNAYVTVTTDALDRTPTFTTVPVNDPADPLTNGTCGPVRCHAEYDFIDVQVAPDGTPWLSAVDACLESVCNDVGELVVAHVLGVDLGEGAPSPSASPTPTVPASPSPTPTPTPTPTPSTSVSPTPTKTPTPTGSTTPSATPTSEGSTPPGGGGGSTAPVPTPNAGTTPTPKASSTPTPATTQGETQTPAPSTSTTQGQQAFDTEVSVAFTPGRSHAPRHTRASGASGTFLGHVQSSASSCIGARRVRLMAFRHGRKKLVARTSTGDRGHFRFPSRNNVQGKFFIRVTRNDMTASGTSITCNAASSPTIVVKRNLY